MSEPDKVPWHLWVVGGLTFLWNGFGAFDFTATVTRFEPYIAGFSQQMRDYWDSFPIWMLLIWGIAVWGGVLGSALI